MITLSTSSKTFLVGEYMVLLGYPAIILNTGPRFELRTERLSSLPGDAEGISPESPAGKYLRRHYRDFEKYSLKFSDPHAGIGGFGASSAQFTLLYAFRKYLADAPADPSLATALESWNFDSQDFLSAYHDVAWDGHGPAPSGADAISQIAGEHLTYWDYNQGDLQSARWPFRDHGFLLVRTHEKVATHLHLKNIQIRSNDKLLQATLTAFDSLFSGDGPSAEKFAAACADYRNELRSLQWVAPSTLSLFETLDQWPELKAYKGCGALGADVLFLFFENRDEKTLRHRLAENGLPVIAGQRDLTGGLAFHPSLKPGNLNANSR